MGYYVKKDANDKPKVSIEYPSFDDAASHCPVGYSIFNSHGKCLYTRPDPDTEFDDEPLSMVSNKETLPVRYEHDKYKYIWDQLKLNIKDRIDALHEAPPTDNLIKHTERLVEERELMRITMMMQSLEENKLIFKED